MTGYHNTFAWSALGVETLEKALKDLDEFRSLACLWWTVAVEQRSLELVVFTHSELLSSRGVVWWRILTLPCTRNKRSLGIPRQTSACANSGHTRLSSAAPPTHFSHTHGEPGDEASEWWWGPCPSGSLCLTRLKIIHKMVCGSFLDYRVT